jgi:hypothetical protein
MLNDVHAPPLEEKQSVTPVHRSVRRKRTGNGDRAHALERTAEHHGGTNLVFGDPEDRGDSFNTTMSAVIVGGVLVSLLVIAWLMWK